MNANTLPGRSGERTDTAPSAGRRGLRAPTSRLLYNGGVPAGLAKRLDRARRRPLAVAYRTASHTSSPVGVGYHSEVRRRRRERLAFAVKAVAGRGATCCRGHSWGRPGRSRPLAGRSTGRRRPRRGSRDFIPRVRGGGDSRGNGSERGPLLRGQFVVGHGASRAYSRRLSWRSATSRCVRPRRDLRG